MTPMNAPTFRAARPRLVCRAVRQWCAIFPGSFRSHLSSCANCQSCLKASLTLEQTLRRDAIQSPEKLGATDSLERDIMRAIQIAGTKPVQSRGKSANHVWALGGLGAAAAIVALMAGLRREPLPEQGGGIAEPATATEVVVIIEAVDSLSTNFVDSVLPKAGGLVANNPLQKEFTSVYSDMRSALDFLALNFLPTAPANSVAAPIRRI